MLMVAHMSAPACSSWMGSVHCCWNGLMTDSLRQHATWLATTAEQLKMARYLRIIKELTLKPPFDSHKSRPCSRASPAPNLLPLWPVERSRGGGHVERVADLRWHLKKWQHIGSRFWSSKNHGSRLGAYRSRFGSSKQNKAQMHVAQTSLVQGTRWHEDSLRFFIATCREVMPPHPVSSTATSPRSEGISIIL